MEIQFTTRIFKEGLTFVAHALELDISSCGGAKEKALKNLKEIEGPKFFGVQRVTLPLPLTHAKA